MTDIISLIKKYVNMRFNTLETSEVVIVESVDYTTWTCSVRPKAKLNIVGNSIDAPIVMNVPIAVPKAGGSVILMPVKVGDVGLCVFSKYALDTLLIDKETNAIKIPRTFDINDAVYIGGVYTSVEDIPVVSEGEILIHHHTGAYLRFDNVGNIAMRGRTITSSEWYP